MEIGWIWNADSVLAICVAFDDECGDIRQLWEFDKIVYVGRLSFLVSTTKFHTMSPLTKKWS
jgi:hypothetical protein